MADTLPPVGEFEVGGPAYRQDSPEQVAAGVPEGYELAPDGLFRRRLKAVLRSGNSGYPEQPLQTAPGRVPV